MEQLKASFLIFLHLPVSRFDASFKCNMDYMQTKMLGLTFSSGLNWSSYIISIAKIASKKIGA